MAHEYADDDPHASEYAGKGPPNDSDSDEGLSVETNANVTKLLTTQGKSLRSRWRRVTASRYTILIGTK